MKTRRALTCASVALTLCILVACGGGAQNPTINAASYDQSCSKASDCVAVLTGPLVCCGGDCGVISKTADAQYTSDLAAAKQSLTCGDFSCPDTACSNFPAVCTGGKCALPKCAQGGTDACKQP